MPELPEVETIVRQVAAHLVGRRIGRVDVMRADVIHGHASSLASLLPGRRVEAVTRRGKRIVLGFDAAIELVFHLGMSGQLTLNALRSPVAAHTHLRIAIRGLASELRFRDPRRFGGVWLLNGAGPTTGRGLSPLGPEPLEISFAAFARLLDRRRQIKPLLLDQQGIAGLGNIYVDEILHAAGVHPLTPAATVAAETRRELWLAMRRILRAAIRAGGSTLRDYVNAAGDAGAFQNRHRVYGRAGEPCRRCRTPIRKTTVAGRGTHVCPNCQPAPA